MKRRDAISPPYRQWSAPGYRRTQKCSPPAGLIGDFFMGSPSVRTASFSMPGRAQAAAIKAGALMASARRQKRQAMDSNLATRALWLLEMKP